MIKECVMCRAEAEFKAPENNEPLCAKCNTINNHIRNQKDKSPKFIHI